MMMLNNYLRVLQNFAVEVIKATHSCWKALVQKQTNCGEIVW